MVLTALHRDRMIDKECGLKQQQFRLAIQKNFTIKTVKYWNRLPEESVLSNVHNVSSNVVYSALLGAGDCTGKPPAIPSILNYSMYRK